MPGRRHAVHRVVGQGAASLTVAVAGLATLAAFIQSVDGVNMYSNDELEDKEEHDERHLLDEELAAMRAMRRVTDTAMGGAKGAGGARGRRQQAGGGKRSSEEEQKAAAATAESEVFERRAKLIEVLVSQQNAAAAKSQEAEAPASPPALKATTRGADANIDMEKHDARAVKLGKMLEAALAPKLVEVSTNLSDQELPSEAQVAMKNMTESPERKVASTNLTGAPDLAPVEAIAEEPSGAESHTSPVAMSALAIEEAPTSNDSSVAPQENKIAVEEEKKKKSIDGDVQNRTIVADQSAELSNSNRTVANETTSEQTSAASTKPLAEAVADSKEASTGENGTNKESAVGCPDNDTNPDVVPNNDTNPEVVPKLLETSQLTSPADDEEELQQSDDELFRLQRLAEKIELHKLQNLAGKVHDRRVAEGVAHERLKKLASRVQEQLQEIDGREEKEKDIEDMLDGEVKSTKEESQKASELLVSQMREMRQTVQDHQLEAASAVAAAADARDASPSAAAAAAAAASAAARAAAAASAADAVEPVQSNGDGGATESVNSWPNYASKYQTVALPHASHPGSDHLLEEAKEEAHRATTLLQTEAKAHLSRANENHPHQLTHSQFAICGNSSFCTAFVGALFGLLAGFVVCVGCSLQLSRATKTKNSEQNKYITAALKRLDDPKYTYTGGAGGGGASSFSWSGAGGRAADLNHPSAAADWAASDCG